MCFSSEPAKILLGLLEVLFIIESNRGAVFCVLLFSFYKNGLQEVLRQTDQLLLYFRRDRVYIQKLKWFLTGLFLCVLVSLAVGDAHIIVTWNYVYSAKGLLLQPWCNCTYSVKDQVPLFFFFSMLPEILARSVLVLVCGCGVVLLGSLTVIKRAFASAYDVHDLTAVQTQYCVVANVIDNINVKLGGLLAFSLMADFIPVCGRVSRLLFLSADPFQINDTLAAVKHVYLILLVAGCYIAGMYFPFSRLHKQVLELQRQILARKRLVLTLNTKELHQSAPELDKLYALLQEQPLVLTPAQGFPIHSNFNLVILTVLSSYTFLLWQTMKESLTGGRNGG
ncbi:hypothetical protein BV898_00603 [Hypsibius exemplaris]|uniref:Uncharacterized protein n=1 Tax=Hypsibius exemplaris TaxID=2072580 RepID=A0A1W0XE76_HYPEX|nr:hypothetical protein BV898_00603 [Hypsibius exemplaris]